VYSPATESPDDAVELTVDELASRAGLPVRTIREYQTMGLLLAPERRGRVGIYRAAHLARLQLIGRLQRRGYSLAGIRDLIGSWRDGADLGEVLGLEADQLVHLDEPGAPATPDQLAALLPTLVPGRIDDLLAAGIIEACGPARYCVPSPSLLQLTVDAIAAGYPPDAVLALLTTIRDSTTAIADATVHLLSDRPSGSDAAQLVALATRGRGLLAHGTGRLTIHAIGRRLGIDHDGETDHRGIRTARPASRTGDGRAIVRPAPAAAAP
jgi:DNA-binding transcriptional MerR regulator